MSKTSAILIGVVVILGLLVAFLLGRATHISHDAPSSLPTPVAAPLPLPPTTLVGQWSAAVPGATLLDWFTFKADGSGTEFKGDTKGVVSETERTFRWSWDKNILHLSNVDMPDVNVSGMPTSLDLGCHLSPDGMTFNQSFDPDGTHPALDSIPDLIYTRQTK